jgi:tRNA-modifying protein YgfZ
VTAPRAMSVEESYRALTETAGVVELERDFVIVSGPQAVEYLQGQLSQDLEALVPGQSALSLLLEPQGKVSAFLRATRTAEDSVLLDFDAGHAETVLGRLRRFKLRTKADIEALEGWRCLALRGPAAGSAAAQSGAVGSAMVTAGFDWPGLTGIDLLGESPVPPDGLPVCDPSAYDALRIECGLPAMGSELDEKTIPEEAGLVSSTISFTKGCFTGQELVARIDSRGSNVPRRLRVVVAASPSAQPTEWSVGAALSVDGSEVGRLTSVAVSPRRGPVGLAYIKRGHDVPFAARLGQDGPELVVSGAPLLTGPEPA